MIDLSEGQIKEINSNIAYYDSKIESILSDYQKDCITMNDAKEQLKYYCARQAMLEHKLGIDKAINPPENGVI